MYHRDGWQFFCKEGRIEGAFLKGRMWLIPADAEKSDDPRYIRKRRCNRTRRMCLE